MELKAIARGAPDEIRTVLEPVLPRVIWCGNGRPPKGDRECFHALLSVLVSGISWEALPPGFPSYKTVQRRLKRWLERDAFRAACRQLAEHDERRHAIERDQVLRDGSKTPSKKGADGLTRRRLTGANPVRPCTWPATTGPCHWGS